MEAQKEWWQILMLDPKELSGIDALWPGPQRLDRIILDREVLYNPQSWIPVTSFLPQGSISYYLYALRL